MRSMTGFGRGTAEVGGVRYVVELRSVNHRFFECKARLPSADGGLEAQLVQRLRAGVERGAVTLGVRIDEQSSSTATLNRERARTWYEAARELGRELGTGETPSLDAILRMPGVVESSSEAPTGLGEALAGALDRAIAELQDSRRVEGQKLRTALEQHLGAIRTLVEVVRREATAAPQHYQRRLHERVEKLLKGAATDVVTALDPQRLAQEVALFADRIDITEELERLGVHLDELGRLFSVDGAVGRRIDFLLQEVNREVNTIGSKSPSAEIATRVVEMKAELEKLREQAQNIE